MQRIVKFTPAYDRRDPDPHQSYGVHGVNLLMILKGSRGAVQFLLFTNWHLPHVVKEYGNTVPLFVAAPLPADLGYHSPKPMFEGHTPMGPCEVLDGEECYYDGSGLEALRVYDVLVAEGGEAVWRELEDYYWRVFGGDHDE